MAGALVLSCPQCDTKIKVRAELQGKRVRCKSCGHTFVAPVAPARRGPDPTAIKAKNPPRPARSRPDEDDPNPYGVTKLDMTARCPHCAKEMESADAIVCIHCGYNTVTRESVKLKKTYETTGQDRFMWLLPGILCVLLMFCACGFDFFFWFGLQSAVWDTIDQDWDLPSLALGIRVWEIIMSLFVMFFAGRFAIRRLIFNREPPEFEKR
jgi:predicted Zn finger-like uncharacterized protein